MPSTLHPTGPADYLSLAEQHQHNQSDSGSLYRSHGYLFTGLVLLLPGVRSHVRDDRHAAERHDDGLVIGTRKKKDVKGKGKMNAGQASHSAVLKGEDMTILVSLCSIASVSLRPGPSDRVIFSPFFSWFHHVRLTIIDHAHQNDITRPPFVPRNTTCGMIENDPFSSTEKLNLINNLSYSYSPTLLPVVPTTLHTRQRISKSKSLPYL